MDKEALFRHLATHHGVVSRVEARSFGVSESTITRRLRSGEWRRAGPGVFRSVAAPETWHGNARCAALGLDGAVSHRAAARVWGLDGFSSARVEITIPYGTKRTQRSLVHTSKQMAWAEVIEQAGVPVTGPERTMLDLAAVLGPAALELALDAALRTRFVSLESLHESLELHSAHGRDGCGRLRSHLDSRDPAKAIPDSGWNRSVGNLLSSAGLPAPVFEHEIRDLDGSFIARVDLAYPLQRLAIELDSVQWHLNRESFDADPRRKNKLVVRGWTVLTFTWDETQQHPYRVVRTVSRALGD